MAKINPAQISSIKNQGIKNMKKLEQNLENYTNKMVDKLLARAEREVPEYGSFKLVYEEFKNPDKNLQATDFMLKISKPENAPNEKLRFLEAVAYDLPKPYIAQRVLASGEKSEILNSLKDSNFKRDLPQTFKNLSEELENI